MMHSPIFCLMGPTASGKTQLAVQLVQHFPLEIISVDSAMVYREMDIGTAKPDADTLRLAPHRLINICDPTDPYSAARFREDAVREINDIIKHQKIPFLVGGTMLYFRALQQGLSHLPSADSALRKKLLNEAAKIGWQRMHERLMTVDPVSAKRIHPNDSQRIQRALEVYELSGKSLTACQEESGGPLEGYRIYNLAVAPNDRAILHQRIEMRFKQMIENGLVDEVKKLLARPGIHPALPAMRSVGYRQVVDFLSGKTNDEEMLARGIIATRQLAKRQLTWLRSWPELTWFDSESPNLFEDVKKYLLLCLTQQD